MSCKGFKQEYSVDYTETCNAVLKVTTVCLVLSLVCVLKFIIVHQLYVQTAFVKCTDMTETVGSGSVYADDYDLPADGEVLSMWSM